ncbi:hypothetical protein VTN02DRAFT_6472 [Thermoascus thermophilus]
MALLQQLLHHLRPSSWMAMLGPVNTPFSGWWIRFYICPGSAYPFVYNHWTLLSQSQTTQGCTKCSLLLKRSSLCDHFWQLADYVIKKARLQRCISPDTRAFQLLYAVSVKRRSLCSLRMVWSECGVGSWSCSAKYDWFQRFSPYPGVCYQD